jgi:general secretion pathway protein G
MTLKQRTVSVQRQLRRAAFTLMEMLVVVAIIVVLAGVGGAYLIGQLNESKVSTAQVKAREVSNAIDMYFVDHSQYPPSLEALLQKDADGKGPYLKNTDALKDPWDRVFQYDPNGANNQRVGAVVVIPDVFCVTPDGRTVGNWKEPKR